MGEAVPPVTSTLPSGNSVALSMRRAYCMVPAARQLGMAWLRSMTSALFTGGSPPPTTKTLPGAYITADP